MTSYGFQGPQALCIFVAAAAGALFFLQTNTLLDFWNTRFVDFVICNRFQGPLVEKIEIWSIYQNDYASKTPIEILYRKA